MKIVDLKVDVEGTRVSFEGEVEVDMDQLDRNEQRHLFQEMLEIVPDTDLAEVFKQFASAELCDMLREHISETDTTETPVEEPEDGE